MKNIHTKIIGVSLLLLISQISFGQLVQGTCSFIFDNCEEELVDFLRDNLADENCYQWEGDCGLDSEISRMGKVAIGSNAFPANAKLGVKDGILTDLITIELCEGEGWCDYVFDQDYDLMPIKGVKEFIDKNGHLPNTPSATEIEEEGGFELKSVKLNHQEKIEEIFLHMIEMEKRVNIIKAEIEKLEKENEQLKN